MRALYAVGPQIRVAGRRRPGAGRRNVCRGLRNTDQAGPGGGELDIQSEDIHGFSLIRPNFHCFLHLFCDLSVVNLGLSSKQSFMAELVPFCKLNRDTRRPHLGTLL